MPSRSPFEGRCAVFTYCVINTYIFVSLKCTLATILLIISFSLIWFVPQDDSLMLTDDLFSCPSNSNLTSVIKDFSQCFWRLQQCRNLHDPRVFVHFFSELFGVVPGVLSMISITTSFMNHNLLSSLKTSLQYSFSIG